jgi:glycine cleavage system transcriptional repressor
MQLTLTILSQENQEFVSDILSAIANCECHVQELRSSRLGQAVACYLLVDGNWNHIAKLENMLDGLQNKQNILIQTLRPNSPDKNIEAIPYGLEIIAADRPGCPADLIHFFLERHITIAEMSISSCPAPYVTNPVLSAKFILLIPQNTHLMTFRDDFLDFCDQLNIDVIIEPLKH